MEPRLPIRSLPAPLRRRAKAIVGPPRVDEAYIAFQIVRRGPRGVVVDVGAHFGESLGPFAEGGWEVHAFEPDESNCRCLEGAWGDRPNVKVTASAVSDGSGRQTLYTSEASSGISSLGRFHDTHVPTVTVPVVALADYIAEKAINRIDVLKVDVEGFEREVLAGHDWAVPPRVVVVEFEDAKTISRGYSWKDLAETIAGHGLRILVSEWYPIERYGGEHRWRAFHEYPCELLDSAGWGNLIAVEPELWPRLRRFARCASIMNSIGRMHGHSN